MVFTDLAQLLVERWGDFVRTKIFNSLVQLLQVVPDGCAALDGLDRFVKLPPRVLSVVVRQPRPVGSARLGSARSTFTRSGTNVQRLPCGDKERKRTCAGSEALNTRGRRYGAHHH